MWLIISIKNMRHNIFLPKFLAFYRLHSFTYEGQRLSLSPKRDWGKRIENRDLSLPYLLSYPYNIFYIFSILAASWAK